MIPNAWVSYKLTKKTLNKGKVAKKNPTELSDEEREELAADLEVFAGAMKWVFYILVIYFIYCILSLFLPISFGMGEDWDEYKSQPHTDRYEMKYTDGKLGGEDEE